MSTLTVNILGIGLLGPGLPDWTAGAAALRDPATWIDTPTVLPPPQRLPATERRRAGPVVKVSLVAADQAVAASGLDAAALPTVFTSSTGEPSNCHALCESLAAPERMVSPTRFTNSVHNAPGGYWHIAVHGMAPSTSLAAHDASFGAGLLEAITQVAATGAPVLLVAADVPYPAPMDAKRPTRDAVGVALVLAPATDTGTTLSLQLVPEAPPTGCGHAGLDQLRQGVPAARALPLLQALARGGSSALVLEGLPGLSLALTVNAA
ncbi:beta-ketoacyl synthase chain length factor [Roseateles sp. DC23W]|uniref:Beta-ketoacyl synthase chain length factor n=1 Tax=Pelomonas dachongensis TaxID=3299029 RepID=A0ABW7EHE0_9BURK